MKNTIQFHFWILLISLLLTNFSLAQQKISQTDDEIIEWLRQNSIPIEHLEAENGFSDLQPLKKILKNVKVVGLGENTHGTREFFQVKHRLLEFLVTEMGFQAFALEASHSNCVPINDYVLYGKGNRENVLTGQGYVVWDTQELLSLIDWIRAYNQRVPDERKVRFYGLDFGYNEVGAEKVAAYLRKYRFKNIEATASLLQNIANLGIRHWPMTMADVQPELKAAYPRLLQLIDELSEHGGKIDAANLREHGQVMMYLDTMKQFLLNNIKDSLPENAHPNMVRSRGLAANLFRILDMDTSVEKIIIWAHNAHISMGRPANGEPNMGYEFRKRFGTAYYALGFEFNEGYYQSRHYSSNALGDLEEPYVVPAPKGYMAWYLSKAMQGNGWLDLRFSTAEGYVRKWLNAPQQFRRHDWLSFSVGEEMTIPAVRYDGILFVGRTTSAVPTPNALETVSRGERF
ncbi:erythromycin esterase family protein [Pricia sp.]|uniref:erythromycin esterase family protein n=1 Tax=Pricia sp. TaxID=2268138 RepID=UPI003593BAB8